jgi:hypothetical protein
LVLISPVDTPLEVPRTGLRVVQTSWRQNIYQEDPVTRFTQTYIILGTLSAKSS